MSTPISTFRPITPLKPFPQFVAPNMTVNQVVSNLNPLNPNAMGVTSPASFQPSPMQAQAPQRLGYPFVNPSKTPVRSTIPPAPESFHKNTIALPPVPQVMAPSKAPVVWQNRLKQMFHDRQAIIYAFSIRTFGAVDKNGDGVIDPKLGENGTYIKAAARLPYLKSLGVNTIHVLPDTPIGEEGRLGKFGAPGSNYAMNGPGLNPEYKEPGRNTTLVQERDEFEDTAHRLGIHVMYDMPSSGANDMAKNPRYQHLFARDSKGHFLTPTNWVDIKVMKKDGPDIRSYFEAFIKNRPGADGFRFDIGRARSLDFWRYILALLGQKASEFESYVTEDASPLANIPEDNPIELLQVGGDSFYGQHHNYAHVNAEEYMDDLEKHHALFQQIGPEKSSIASFVTHDDPPAMAQGGVLYSKHVLGMMAAIPDANMYITDGMLTGFDKHFPLFDWHPPLIGKYPQIEQYYRKVVGLRLNPLYNPALTKGKFVRLQIDQDKQNPRVIAFLRQYGKKTLLIVANKAMSDKHQATIHINGLSQFSRLKPLLPEISEPGQYLPANDRLSVNLSRGAFQIFDLDLYNEQAVESSHVSLSA